MFGWMGKVLRVDLSSGTVEELPFDGAVWRRFLGGRGFGSRFLYDAVGPGTDALDPGAALVFAAGPLTGTRTPASSRFSLSFKSPLTGTMGDAGAGGRWGVLLKRCGLDALVVAGRSSRPVTLAVTEGGVALRDASGLWGLDTEQTRAALLGEEGKGAGLLCIGPAGERRVRFACIVDERAHALGRGGAGAVMGSKNLKAVTVSGSTRIEVADPERMKFCAYEADKLVRAHPLTSKGLPELGTAVIARIVNEAGIWPTRNFQDSMFEGAERLCGEAIARTLLKKRDGCPGCVIRCRPRTATAAEAGEGPEFETAWALGAALGVDDLEAVAEAGYLCNRLGLDTISAGGTLACAMELAERGVAEAPVRFGEAAGIKSLLEDVALRRGAGDALAEGAKRYAARCGAPELAMQVKGLELPGYDPRGAQGQGLGYATSNRGGCHLRGGYLIGTELLGVPRRIDRFSPVGKAGYAVRHQDFGAAADSLVVCRFMTFAVSEIVLARLLSAVTGEGWEPEDLMRAGERISNLERMFNLREGFTAKDDTLPRRLLEEPVRSGPAQGRVVELATLLDEYYRFRGWDASGVPRPETLEALGLEFAGHGR